MLVPPTQSISTPRSRSARYTPSCARPRAPPPASTRPTAVAALDARQARHVPIERRPNVDVVGDGAPRQPVPRSLRALLVGRVQQYEDLGRLGASGTPHQVLHFGRDAAPAAARHRRAAASRRSAGCSARSTASADRRPPAARSREWPRSGRGARRCGWFTSASLVSSWARPGCCKARSMLAASTMRTPPMGCSAAARSSRRSPRHLHAGA